MLGPVGSLHFLLVGTWKCITAVARREPHPAVGEGVLPTS